MSSDYGRRAFFAGTIQREAESVETDRRYPGRQWSHRWIPFAEHHRDPASGKSSTLYQWAVYNNDRNLLSMKARSFFPDQVESRLWGKPHFEFHAGYAGSMTFFNSNSSEDGKADKSIIDQFELMVNVG